MTAHLCVAPLLFITAHASLPTDRIEDKVGLQIDDFIGTVRIVRSDQSAVRVVSITEGGSDLGRVVVEESAATGLRIRGMPAPIAMNCIRTNGNLSISFEDGAAHPITEFPSIVVSVPESADVKLVLRAGNAEVSETENLEILAGGCANVVAKSVKETLRLTTTGAARFSVEHARRADIDASNGGQIKIANIGRLLSACLGRTSKLNSEKVAGAAQVFMSGTSRATLADVDLSELTAELDGASQLDVSGVASNSRIAIGAAARAYVNDGVKLGEVNLTRAGRLIVDGERWRGPEK
ncbi:hypothetical protein [uncultured Hyphomonas sp.]|uniref:hypothetical protein n=1 Tax=uncultured Hyphomonas sp. TaxID=225298 RepID=UPI002AABFBAC|nr:hypothetical protein [uncultured Hyphomonas sp.]